MHRELSISLLDMVMCLSHAIDLISSKVADHHQRVSYIAFKIAEAMGLHYIEQRKILIAGAIHDLGAISLKERLETLSFEFEDPENHAGLGFEILNRFEPFRDISYLVKYHHTKNCQFKDLDVPENVIMGSQILHLADRIEILINKERRILSQSSEIEEVISSHSGDWFHPEAVKAFLSISKKEYFWLDVASKHLPRIIHYHAMKADVFVTMLDIKSLMDLTRIFSQIVDLRSKFTVTHSMGVSAVSEALARFVGFSETECQMMRIAGNLHDLGKLAVPESILEKNGKLDRDEFHNIKSHTYHTYRILENISEFDVINQWASYHHERLNGNGYPFGLDSKDLSLGSRVLAVADVFTAVTEDRPYRKGMDSEQALNVIQNMSDNNILDPNVVLLLTLNYDRLIEIRKNAQIGATEITLSYEHLPESQTIAQMYRPIATLRD